MAINPVGNATPAVLQYAVNRVNNDRDKDDTVKNNPAVASANVVPNDRDKDDNAAKQTNAVQPQGGSQTVRQAIDKFA